MRITDVLVETNTNAKSRLDEKPMGILSKLGNKALSKLGSGRAAGRLSTGDLANKIHKEYDTYLGKTGQEPSKESVLAFLQFKGYPTQGAEKILNSPEAQGQAPTGPLGKGSPGAARPGAGKASAAPGADKIEPKMGDEPAGDATAPTDGKTEPTMGAEKPNFSTGPQPTMKGADGKALPTGIPSTTDPLAAIRKNAGLPPAADKPAAPAADVPGAPPGDDKKAAAKSRIDQMKKDKAAGTGFGGFVKGAKAKGLVTAGMYEATAIPSSVIDKALLKAAQDAERMGIGQALGDPEDDQQGAPAGPMSKGGAGGGQQGGFMAGVKQGMGGGAAGDEDPAKVKGSLNINQLSSLMPGVDPRQLQQAVARIKAGQEPSRMHMQTLAQAFTAIVQADPQTTQQIMMLLKRVSAA